MLEDWKKYSDSEWSKNDDKYSYVKVWKIGLSAKERKRRGIKAYGFEARLGTNGSTEKDYFDKKSEALASAMKYMKEN